MKMTSMSWKSLWEAFSRALDEIDVLAAQATPGPVHAEVMNEGYANEILEIVTEMRGKPGERCVPVVASVSFPPDAALIVALLNAWPVVIAELRRLREHERTCVETASDEEIDRQLRAAGIDPVDVTERTMTLVDSVLKWRGRVESVERERDEARAEVERLRDKRDRIRRLINPRPDVWRTPTDEEAVALVEMLAAEPAKIAEHKH